MAMALNMKASGSMIFSTAMVWRPGLTVPYTQVSIRTGGKMDVVSLSGQMGATSVGNSKIMISKALASITGQTDECSLETGRATKCMAMAYSRGQTTVCMRDPIEMIRKKDSGSLHGPTARSTKGSGKMGNSMGRGSTPLFPKDVATVYGRKDEEKRGLTSNHNSY